MSSWLKLQGSFDMSENILWCFRFSYLSQKWMHATGLKLRQFVSFKWLLSRCTLPFLLEKKRLQKYQHWANAKKAFIVDYCIALKNNNRITFISLIGDFFSSNQNLFVFIFIFLNTIGFKFLLFFLYKHSTVCNLAIEFHFIKITLVCCCS